MAQEEVVKEKTVFWCGEGAVGLVVALILTPHMTLTKT